MHRPVKSPSEAVASGSDDEHSAHYSSSGYYESPPDEEEGYGSAGSRIPSGERREWTEEEKRRRKKGFKLDFSPKIEQERTESTSPAGKETSLPLLNKILVILNLMQVLGHSSIPSIPCFARDLSYNSLVYWSGVIPSPLGILVTVWPMAQNVEQLVE
jgi:hypothetical protein